MMSFYSSVVLINSCLLHSNINQKQIDLIVEGFLSSLSIVMNENPMITCYRLDYEIQHST